MRVRASIFFRSSFAAKRHGVLLGLSLLLLRPDAALSEIVFSGARNIAIPTNFDGVYINIGNGSVEGGCEVHNPAYDFNDAALPLGAAFFGRLVETRLKA